MPITGVLQNNHLDPDIFYYKMDFDLNVFYHYEECHTYSKEFASCDCDDLPEYDFDCPLIGFKKTKRKPNTTTLYYDFKESLGFYIIPDKKSPYSMIVGEIYSQIIRSRYYTLSAMCSPCFPGQGDLDTIGIYKAYCPDPDSINQYCDFDTKRIKKGY